LLNHLRGASFLRLYPRAGVQGCTRARGYSLGTRVGRCVENVIRGSLSLSSSDHDKPLVRSGPTDWRRGLERERRKAGQGRVDVLFADRFATATTHWRIKGAYVTP
jgi:hypothetical protein